MNYVKFLMNIALSSVLLMGYVSTSAANATQEDYNAAMADAKKSLKIAEDANYEWRDSGKILKKAAEAAKSGNFSVAIKLANKAKQQGYSALLQSRQQTKAGPR